MTQTYVTASLDSTMQASLLRQCSRHACLARPPHAGKAHDIQPVALPQRKIDVVGFGNLCVDVFQEVDSLPPAEHAVRKALLDELTRTCTDRSAWELGGNTNFMIAAARLGMNTAAVGHTGSDVFGQFLDSVLQV